VTPMTKGGNQRIVLSSLKRLLNPYLAMSSERALPFLVYLGLGKVSTQAPEAKLRDEAELKRTDDRRPRIPHFHSFRSDPNLIRKLPQSTTSPPAL